MEQKPIRHADQIVLNTHPEHTIIGDNTTVGTIAHRAAIHQIALNTSIGDVKEGDQFEWKAELTGRITVTRSMLDAVTEQYLR